MIEVGDVMNYNMLMTVAGIAIALWSVVCVTAILIISKRRSDRDLDRVSGVIKRAFEPFSERPKTKRKLV